MVKKNLGFAFFGGVAAATLMAVSAWADTTEDRKISRAEVKMIVIEEADALKVDPALALAIAEVESAFKPDALSHKGARGVMQIMPATVEGEYGLHRDILWEPRLNVRIGLHFFKRLLAQYRQNEEFALSYYNGGSRVGVWPNAKVIPATKGYVEKVLAKRDDYLAK